MLTLENMREVVKNLIDKTREREVPWQPEEESLRAERVGDGLRLPVTFASNSFVAFYAHSIIRFKRQFERTEVSSVFVFQGRAGETLGVWQLFPGDPDWQLASDLYDAIVNQMQERLGEQGMPLLLKDILNGPVQSAVEERQEDLRSQEFFRWVAGYWMLTFFRGEVGLREDLRIDENGAYFTQRRGTTPYFFLRDVYYDPEARNVSFAKVFATGTKQGKVRQREVLEISEDGKKLSGYAQHDGHKLIYSRLTKEEAGW